MEVPSIASIKKFYYYVNFEIGQSVRLLARIAMEKCWRDRVASAEENRHSRLTELHGGTSDRERNVTKRKKSL